jgi:hypothetical protein
MGLSFLALAVKNSSKFFFAATTDNEGTELWESDGTGPDKPVERHAPGRVLVVMLSPFQTSRWWFIPRRQIFYRCKYTCRGNRVMDQRWYSGQYTLVKDIDPFGDGLASSFNLYRG